MANVITYEEYCNALGISFSAETPDPSWFRVAQERAMRMIKKCIPQRHLVPETRIKLAALKCEYLSPVIEGIAYQIQYMHDNMETYDNGYLNISNSFGTGQYNQGPTPAYNVQKIFGALCPMANDIFIDLGWMYASLERKIPMSEFYKESTDWTDPKYKDGSNNA